MGPADWMLAIFVNGLSWIAPVDEHIAVHYFFVTLKWNESVKGPDLCRNGVYVCLYTLHSLSWHVA